MSEVEVVRIEAPLTREAALGLQAGTPVAISGSLIAARDAAHKRLVEARRRAEALPFDLTDQLIYYVGPTPPRLGQPIGSAGPTTSYRMDPFTVPLLKAGCRGAIGKGARSQEVKDALREYGAVYFLAVGGTGALIRKSIYRVEILAYEELGTEAVRRLWVRDFPAIVANDAHGGDLFVEGMARYGREKRAG